MTKSKGMKDDVNKQDQIWALTIQRKVKPNVKGNLVFRDFSNIETTIGR